ncbi:hypothetical protein PHMEG_0003457 [Phytophthora megakarya]|uniref:Uncharacterized protein n=1 Tax=Phytophthora megakarya TaxID=4795 RepID=A0A225WW82_9STRA|nr:hypothetical protein PHMEG_0003457 [Phytophthora megakarya]
MALRVRVIGPGSYTLTPPRGNRSFTIRHYQQLRRWCASIFACVPQKVWTITLDPVRPSNFPKLSNKYSWCAQADRSVVAVVQEIPNSPALKVNQNAQG